MTPDSNNVANFEYIAPASGTYYFLVKTENEYYKVDETASHPSASSVIENIPIEISAVSNFKIAPGLNSNRYYWDEPIHPERIVAYELWGSVVDFTTPPEPYSPNGPFYGGTPSNLIYRGLAREFTLLHESPYSGFRGWLRAVDRMGNASPWMRGQFLIYSGDSLSAPIISVDTSTSTDNLVVLHVSATSDAKYVKYTSVQVRKVGDSWPSTSDYSNGQIVFDGLPKEVVIPCRSSGQSLEMRCRLIGTSNSGWSDTLTYNPIKVNSRITVDFPTINVGEASSLTTTLAGLGSEDSVVVTPVGALETGLVWFGKPEANVENSLEVRLANLGMFNINPARRDFQVEWWKRTSSLSAGLISFWKLDEASGQRIDSKGTNNLTDVNTVGQAVGKIGTAADFISTNSEYLYKLSNTAMQTGDIDFTFSAWVYLSSKTSTQTILCKQSSVAGTREYVLQYEQSTDRFNFLVFKHTDILHGVISDSSPAINTWYNVVAWHDSTLDTIYIQVNNGLISSLPLAGSIQPDSTENFIIGHSGINAAPYYFNGRIDAVGYWKRLLTASERAVLYNNGNGIEYPFTS